MKAVFMGTPDFAAGILKALIENGVEVVCAVTKEDKARGRGKEVSFSPVKAYALENGIEVFQPKKIKEESSVNQLRSFLADIFIVAAYGQILSKEILDIPRYGCINVHASLLPKYRGAAPIQWSIVSGDKVTGVTIMKMDEGLDTGDILLKREIDIRADETGESLFDRLMLLGQEAVIEAIEIIENGNPVLEKQDDASATYAPILKKEMGRLDLSKDASSLERLVRGFYPWPGAFLHFDGKLLKILSAEAVPCGSCKAYSPGTVISLSEGIDLATGQDILRLKEVQLEGRKRMSAADFLRGHKMKEGDVLG